jgi:hypothetical protein
MSTMDYGFRSWTNPWARLWFLARPAVTVTRPGGQLQQRLESMQAGASLRRAARERRAQRDHDNHQHEHQHGKANYSGKSRRCGRAAYHQRRQHGADPHAARPRATQMPHPEPPYPSRTPQPVARACPQWATPDLRDSLILRGVPKP